MDSSSQCFLSFHRCKLVGSHIAISFSFDLWQLVVIAFSFPSAPHRKLDNKSYFCLYMSWWDWNHTSLWKGDSSLFPPPHQNKHSMPVIFARSMKSPLSYWMTFPVVPRCFKYVHNTHSMSLCVYICCQSGHLYQVAVGSSDSVWRHLLLVLWAWWQVIDLHHLALSSLALGSHDTGAYSPAHMSRSADWMVPELWGIELHYWVCRASSWF